MMTPSERHETTQLRWLKWMELTAVLASLVGFFALVALLTHNAWADTPARPGLQPGPAFGGNAFGNPIRRTVPAPSDDLWDDDDEDADFGDDRTPPPAFGTNAGRIAAPGDAKNPISMGGNAPGNVVSPPNSPKPIAVNTETGEGSKEVVTDFNFPDADILDIAKTLGKLTGKNFILDKDVKGRITIISNSPVTVGDAWRAFLTALDINGFALIPSGNYIRIARQRDARDKQLKTYTGEHAPDTDSLITRVFQLKYIDSEEVARTFRSFMPANSRIIPYSQTNTVIVTDTGSNIAKLQKMLDILDVEGFDAGIEVIPVKFASAVELSKLIDTLIPGTGTGPTAGGAPRFGGGGGKFNARRTKEGGIINTIIADDRTNTLIVHANSKGADQVRTLVSKLDQKMPVPAGGGKVNVVYLQFADAEQIATTLNNLSSSAGARPVSIGSGGTGINPVSASLFEGSIKVSPDKSTNSLVITASPSDFATVQRVISKLDIPRDEVYVEVVIMEISLGRDFQFSANVANPAKGIGFMPNSDLLNWVQNPISQKGAILGFASEGKTDIKIGTTTVSVPNVAGLIRAIQTNSNSNVLATPQIIALDNSEATFESAEKVPIPTSTTSQGVVSTTLTKESVSLSIKIKPQINKISNFVKMDIDAKLADFSNRQLPAQVQDMAQATIERNAKTTVVVGDADTVVIGGLIRDKISESVSKIPILGDLPLLGWFFRSKENKSEKTNLLIFLTPHIIHQYEKVRAVLDKKLKERDDFIESNMGGKDPLREKRDDMIRSLPDIKEVMKKRTDSTFSLDEDRPANDSGNPFTGGSTESAPPKTAPAKTAPATTTAPQATVPNAPPLIPSGDNPPALSAPPPAPPMGDSGVPPQGP